MPHHSGKCIGGPYDGELRNYFENTMPVLSPLNIRNNGQYEFFPDKENSSIGVWCWSPLVKS